MLWYKAWRDTRWRFLIGLVILSGTALGCVFAYPSVKGILGVVIVGGPSDLVTQETKWMAELSANLRGYIWAQLIRNNMFGLWSLFAVLLGAEGVISRRSGAVFTLSLPVSRRRLCTVRASTDLAELLLLALVPMVLITIAAPAIDSSYALTDALVHGISIFIGGAMFYAGHSVRGSLAAHPHRDLSGRRRRGLQDDSRPGAVYPGERHGWRELFPDRHPVVGGAFRLGGGVGGHSLRRHTLHRSARLLMSSIISLKGVLKRYVRGKQQIEVLHKLALEVASGEFLSLMGPSGSGKTTLLNLIAGLDHPTEGEIEVAGERIDRLSGGELAAWRARHVGFVFQFYNLLPVLTAQDNVEVPLLLTNLSSAQRKRNARMALELVGLGDRATHKPNELSGGQLQRVSIARAIVSDPTLLVCDEPTGDLDRENAEEILDLLQMLNRDHGKTIIMVTHDSLAAEHASRRLHLDKGHLVDAPVRQVA